MGYEALTLAIGWGLAAAKWVMVAGSAFIICMITFDTIRTILKRKRDD